MPDVDTSVTLCCILRHRDSVEVTDVESTTSPTPSPMKGARIHPVGGAKDTPDQNLSSEEVAVRQVNDEVSPDYASDPLSADADSVSICARVKVRCCRSSCSRNPSAFNVVHRALEKQYPFRVCDDSLTKVLAVDALL